MTMEDNSKYNINDRNEMSSILDFLLNTKGLGTTKPENLDISYFGNTKLLQILNVNDNLTNIDVIWKELSFNISISHVEGAIIPTNISISKLSSRKLLPSYWNNIAEVNESPFIGDILYFDNALIIIEFDKGCINFRNDETVNFSLTFNDDNVIQVDLICTKKQENDNKNLFSFQIKSHIDDISSIFEKSDTLYMNEMISEIIKHTVKLSTVGVSYD